MNQEITLRGGNQIEYRGMICQVVFHADRLSLYGKVVTGVNGRFLIFEAQSVDGIVDAFVEAVDKEMGDDFVQEYPDELQGECDE
jgi:hypothetical protein